jgi:flavin-dependent dehydrogenase
MNCDVAIIGGGPAGSTVGSMLKKYCPSLDVAIFEAENFPRDHVGESQLPVIGHILTEIGVWDKVEAANFPIKVGATYRWGLPSERDLWYFNFLAEGKLQSEPRPAKFLGQRQQTAFQCDRAVYDKILLDHSRELGCRVYEQARVRAVFTKGDRIDSLEGVAKGGSASELGEQFEISARWYVDASGGESLTRKAFQVEVQSPPSLRNIAIWDYWKDAEWAERVGNGGTFVQVMSIGWGWLWFIPLGPTRSSLGLVTSADYYKKSGLSAEELYLLAISQEPRIRALVENAERDNALQATKDWSFVSDRLYGENWFLAGDACGFADPILAAGMSLAHLSGQRVAYSLLEILRGDSDEGWIKDQYQTGQRRTIGNHIRFADFWYSANAQFTELKEYCSQIAKDAGLNLEPDKAFQWLGTGGFAEELAGVPFAGGYRMSAVKDFAGRFGGTKVGWVVDTDNLFKLDVEGAEKGFCGVYESGRVLKIPCFTRGGKTLPNHRFYGIVFRSLLAEQEIQLLAERFMFEAAKLKIPANALTSNLCRETLEALVAEGWVKSSYDPTFPLLRDYGNRN